MQIARTRGPATPIPIRTSTALKKREPGQAAKLSAWHQSAPTDPVLTTALMRNDCGRERPSAAWSSSGSRIERTQPQDLAWGNSGAMSGYEGVDCLACAQVHFINRKTGKVLGSETS